MKGTACQTKKITTVRPGTTSTATEKPRGPALARVARRRLDALRNDYLRPLRRRIPRPADQRPRPHPRRRHRRGVEDSLAAAHEFDNSRLLSVRKEMSSCLAADGTSAGKLPQNLAAVPAAAKRNTTLFTRHLIARSLATGADLKISPCF